MTTAQLTAHTLRIPTAGVLCALIAFALTGCGAPDTARSGFLRDYSSLKPSPVVEGALHYQNPSRPLSMYDKFILERVQISFAPGAAGVAVDPDELKMLTEYFRNEAVKALSVRYKVVDEPGPRVLRIRAAITDVRKAKVAMNIHPATKLSGVGLGGASMEAEGIDSQSGERVLATVDSRQGSRMGR